MIFYVPVVRQNGSNGRRRLLFLFLLLKDHGYKSVIIEFKRFLKLLRSEMTGLLINISRKQALIYAGFLVLYEFLTYIANDMIMPGMIKVVHGFHGPESAIALSLTAYVLGGASLQLLLGPFSDRYGRRPVMLGGALFFFICTLLIACTTSIEQFLWARFFQGMGLCFISVIGYATLQEIFSEMAAIRLIAIMTNVAVSAPLLGPLFGALFIYYYDWRFIFLAIAGLALIALWGLWQFMPEPVGQIRKDGELIKPSVFSVQAVMASYRDLLKNSKFVLGSMALGIIYLPCMAWIGLSPIILVKVAHLSVINYGLWQIPVFGAFILGNLFLHRMTHFYTLPRLIYLGSLIAGLSLIGVYFCVLFKGSAFIWLMPGLVVYFFGAGIIGAPLGRFILFSTSIGKGTASALMSMISMCIQAFGIELANHLYTGHDNYVFAVYCLVVAIVYFVVLLLLRGKIKD
jgi:DHA1 family multidrug/chloramphenicol efflux transport protein-like MFS transporter